MLEVAVRAEDDWPSDDWAAAARLAAREALAGAGVALGSRPAEISLLLTGDEAVRTLNRDYRGKDSPTNVLSFPQLEGDPAALLAADGPGELLIGDIALALGVCRDEAAARGIALRDHVIHLVVHGTLHLLGHDHRDDDEAAAMERIETEVMRRLGLHDPYQQDEEYSDGR